MMVAPPPPAVPREADRVDAEDARGAAADRAAERQRVFRHHRVTAEEAVLADAAELVHRRAGTDVRVVLDRHVAAERRVRAEDRVAADMAVVRHVDVRHQQVVIADRRLAAAAGGAAVDRREFADGVVRADRQPGALTVILEVLRREADRRHREDVRSVADLRPAVDHRGRFDAAVPPDRHLWTDADIRADRRSVADPRAGMDLRRRIDPRGARLDREQQAGFRDALPFHVRHRLHLREPRAPPSHRHLEQHAIAGHDLPAELRVVDAAQRDRRVGRGARRVEDQHRGHLRQRLDHQDRGHHR
jgi:hypothetical protein